ncbi:HoxN/HupN/NixA family nickel/cobalt transporter [Stappia albiluteola]|nr:high frequency lysogenization protein HflD [Stappia albiluteola]
MDNVLLLGFLVGMGHALEADHLAAVGALSTHGSVRRHMALRGFAWGLGHTLTLFAICTAVIVFAVALTPERAAALEFAVGAMLILLAAGVLWRLWRTRIHFHVHSHDDGRRHIHAHSHRIAEIPHSRDRHAHIHAHFPLSALLVGLVHGAAGSAGLLALAVSTVNDPYVALSYILIFGLGSMVGMATLTTVAAWPLGAMERGAGWLHSGTMMAVAAVAAWLGFSTLTQTWALAAGAF